MVNIQFILNGEDLLIQAEAGDTLAQILANQRLSSSVHDHCGTGLCGRCMVLFNGQPSNACLIPAFAVRNSEIITWEGLVQTPEYGLIEEAIAAHKLELCPFCRPAVCLLMASLLDSKSRPAEGTIETTLSALLCRCTPAEDLFAAARTAVSKKEGRLLNDARQ